MSTVWGAAAQQQRALAILALLFGGAATTAAEQVQLSTPDEVVWQWYEGCSSK